MRTASIALLMGMSLTGATSAAAADLGFDTLRGSDYGDAYAQPLTDWSGVYVGGHGGYTSAGFSQRDAVRSRLIDFFRATTIESEFEVSKLVQLPGARTSGTAFGALLGVNFQYDEVVFGIEADYTWFDRTGTSRDEIGRIVRTSTGYAESVVMSARSTTSIKDYGTVRGRAGWAIGNLMPYVTVGLAVGRVTTNDSVAVQHFGYDATTYAANQSQAGGTPSYVYNFGYASFNQNYPGVRSTPPGGGVQTVPARPEVLSSGPKTKTVAGVALGAGLEYALTPNILLRGEYQYVLFQKFDGHQAELNTVRGGAAFKF